MSFYVTESRTLGAGDLMTALYDHPGAARRAVDRLRATGVTPDKISVLAASPEGAGEIASSGPIFDRARSSTDEAGLLRLLLDAGIPDYEAALYERRILDGGVMVGVGVNGDAREVERILLSFDPVKVSLR